MSNGHACCILGVCCPPGSASQRETLAKEIQKHHTHLRDDRALDCAARVLAAFEDFKRAAEIIVEYAQ